MIDQRIQFDERYDNPEFNTTTLYFIAPVELLKGKYPEAESMEISVEFPTDKPEASYADVMFSPTKEGSDYDWFYGGMSYGEIEALIRLAMSANAVRRTEGGLCAHFSC